jgi:thioesterase domain-containing protein
MGLKGFRERRIASLFSEVLGVPVERGEDDFFALGGDDRSAEALLEVIAEDAGVRLASDAVVRHPTVSEMAHEVATTRPMRRGRVVVFGEDAPGRPLFCLMAAFQARAIALHYTAMAGRPFVVIQPAGLEERVRADRTVERRGKRAIADIKTIQPNGPYTIAGYSNDAWVAYEVARQLRAAGEDVTRVVPIDLWAPVFSRPYTLKLKFLSVWTIVAGWQPEPGPWFDARRRLLYVREVARATVNRSQWWLRSWTAGIVQRPSTLQGRLFHELMNSVVIPYRGQPSDVAVTLIRGTDFGGLEWQVKRAPLDMSWRRLTSGAVDVVSINANHIEMLEGANAHELARALLRGD